MLYPNRIIIPTQVYNEINKPRIQHLRQRIDQLINNGNARILDMNITSPEYALYQDLTTTSPSNLKAIGSGEAACIALAKEKSGIIASNNLRDINQYIKKYDLIHKTTGDILVEALNKGLITENQGNEIRSEMLKKRRKIGARSFSEYLQTKNK